MPRWARFEYWRAPEKTAAAWRGDRVTVGDLGRVDDDGTVWLDGRREDLVISGGVNVYPAEVEAVLDAHPDVVESAVFGLPDEEWGQRVVAAYVGTADPARAGRLGPASGSRRRSGPRRCTGSDELPRTSTGKVRRLDLPEVARRLPRAAEEWDVVVVGAGTAGCPLAARLADAGRRVLLLEAGADHPAPADFPAELRDPARMARRRRRVTPTPGTSQAELTDDRDGAGAPRPRGRRLQRAQRRRCFLRGTPADYDGWAAAGNDLWSYAAVLPAFRRLETDHDFGVARPRRPRGPCPVRRYRDRRTRWPTAFAAAAAELGFPAEPDKNAGGPPGVGPVPLTVVGRRAGEHRDGLPLAAARRRRR